MSIDRLDKLLRRRGRVKAPRGKFKHRHNRLPRQMEPLHDFFDCGPGLKIFDTMATGIRVSLNTHAPLTFPGMLSTAGHWDQSRIAIFVASLHRSWLRHVLPRS